MRSKTGDDRGLLVEDACAEESKRNMTCVGKVLLALAEVVGSLLSIFDSIIVEMYKTLPTGYATYRIVPRPEEMTGAIIREEVMPATCMTRITMTRARFCLDTSAICLDQNHALRTSCCEFVTGSALSRPAWDTL